ncbi:MAG: FAD-dependent oxidoreductase [bacterium]|nr:FAD-dependent oxidoreductase [bacterium]
MAYRKICRIESDNQDVDWVDVLIVGAGISGLYGAWRLLQDNPLQKVLVLEALDGIGGRLHTDIVEMEADSHATPRKKVLVKCETGGMRFLKTHQHVMRLLHVLHLEDQIIPFGMGDENNLYYFRGKRMKRSELSLNVSHTLKGLYRLYKNEKNKSIEELLYAALGAVLHNDKKGNTARYKDCSKYMPETPEDWQHVRFSCCYKGRPLYQWGFRDLLEDIGLFSTIIYDLAQWIRVFARNTCSVHMGSRGKYTQTL